MYKNRSRSAQRGRDRFERERHVFYIEGIPTDEAERRNFFARIAAPAYRPKLGGWPISKFTAAEARFSLQCQPCRHCTRQYAPAEFAREFTRQHDGTKLIIVKRMTTCPKCGTKGGRRIIIRISVGGYTIEF